MPEQKSNIKWRAIGGLGIVVLALVMGWYWVWGVLFLSWIIPDFYSGETNLLEPVNKADNPILFWIIMILWVGLSLFLIGYDIWRLVVSL